MRIETFPASAVDVGAGLPVCGVAIASGDPLVVFEIDRPEVNLAIWDRNDTEPYWRETLRPLMACAPFTAIAEGRPTDIAPMLSAQLPVTLTEALSNDVTGLAAAFATLDDDNGFVRVRLEALTHNGCYHWHADAVGLRMLCTYYGCGTEWLSLDGGATTARACNRRKPSCQAAQITTGAVAVMKGERYPGNAGNGCIHRSAPAGPGEKARLVLCVDQTKWNLSNDD